MTESPIQQVPRLKGEGKHGVVMGMALELDVRRDYPVYGAAGKLTRTVVHTRNQQKHL